MNITRRGFIATIAATVLARRLEPKTQDPRLSACERHDAAYPRGITITGVPKGGRHTVGRKLYRSPQGSSTYQLIAVINDNTTTYVGLRNY